jgi:fatty-acyl-CoA synthase
MAASGFASYAQGPTDDPVQESTVGSVLRAAATAAGSTLAVSAWGMLPGERRTWTYAELLRDAERTARALLTHFKPGEHIAVYAPNVAEWLLLELGAGLAGVVLVTVNPAYRAKELDFVLRQSRAAGVFHSRQCRGNPLEQWVAETRSGLPHLRHAVVFDEWDGFLASAVTGRELPAVTPDHAAQIQYTSGTTGNPKGALLDHRGLTNNSRYYAQLIQLQEGEVYGHAMPFFHTAGCVMATLGTIQARATHAFLPVFDPGRLLELIEREHGAVMLGVPTMMIAMMEHPDFSRRDLSSLRVAVAGGSSVPPEIVRAIEAKLGVTFSIVYGQTEACPLITMTRLADDAEEKASTVGQPMPQCEVKVADPMTGEPVPHGTIGELCARGYMVMREYFERPEATAAAVDREGWLHTGDLGTMDARGYCRVTGRLKDMVIRGGENLFPAEIEAALIEHASVTEAAVIGVPDPRMGEELVAFIRISGEHVPDIDDLRRHVRQRLAAPKTPRYWVFLAEFPLTGSGKIQKFVLRERWSQGAFAPVDSVARPGAPVK